MEAEIKILEGITAVGISGSNHWVPLDGSKAFKGREAANSPMELVLIALGGCTAMDVASILTKMHQPFSDLKILLNAEQKEEYPRVFTKIMIKYVITGDVEVGKLEKAISLSQEKYCPVSAMLGCACPIEWEYDIK